MVTLLCLFDFLKNSSPELKSSKGILSPIQTVLLGLIRIMIKFVREGLGLQILVRPLSPAHFYMLWMHFTIGQWLKPIKQNVGVKLLSLSVQEMKN